NLGHTFGHAIENVAGYGEYLHGEAVAIGLCAAARLSQKLGYITADDIIRVERVLQTHQLPVKLAAPLPYAVLHDAMGRDKKVRASGPRFVVMKRIGHGVTQDGVAPSLVEASFREVGAVLFRIAFFGFRIAD